MPGPPKSYPTNQDRQAAYRQRKAQRDALVNELILALRNADLPPGLHRVALDGDELELLEALVNHYRSQNWNNKKADPSRSQPIHL